MFDKFKQRHLAGGNSMSQAMLNQSDSIMNATFDRDPAFKRVLINGEYIDSKYKVHAYTSLSAGNSIDYYLQFRPGVYYDPGTYVDIPNRDGKYERWLIVLQDDLPQFPMHYVLKCDWTLKWVLDGKIYSCLGVHRSQLSYNSGLWTDFNFTTPENQTKIWLPTTQDTKTLNYGQRVLISNNELHPIAWEVSKIEDTLPFGVTKLTFTQCQFDEHRDNAKLMIADYYASNIELEPKVEIPPKPFGDHSRITFNGTQQVLKVNGSYKTITAHFYDREKNELDIEPFWTIKFPSDEDKDKFDIFEDGKNLKIKCLNYYDLIGKIVTICLNDESGTMLSTLDLEVVGL